LQTTLQRCPLNSVEQLGQIEDASFFEATGAVATPGASAVDFRITVELICGVVAHLTVP
jgi:hypothetical protein